MSFYLFLSALIGALIAYIAYLDIMAPGHGILVLGKEDAEPRNSTPGTFKFVTYNLFIRPPGIHSNGEDFKDERLMDFADVADRYDVLCLQELFVLGSHRRARFLHKVAAKGLRYSVHIPSKKWGVFPPRVIDGGVTILSRFPILETEYELYHDATMSTADTWCAKGIVWAKIALPGAEARHVHVMSTHMQAHDHPDGRYSKVRLLQAAQIRAFVVRKVRDGAAVILAGDFNVNGRRARDDGMADSDEYAQVWRILTGAGAGAGTDGEGGGEGRAWRDVLRDFHAGEHVITGGDEYMVNRGCKPASQEHCSKRLDYVLVADASDAAQGNVRAQACRVEPFETPQDKPYVRLSDHLAVEVDFAYD